MLELLAFFACLFPNYLAFSKIIKSFVNTLNAILKEGISISKGMTASSPFTIEYGVAPIVVISLILYEYRAYGN